MTLKPYFVSLYNFSLYDSDPSFAAGRELIFAISLNFSGLPLVNMNVESLNLTIVDILSDYDSKGKHFRT